MSRLWIWFQLKSKKSPIGSTIRDGAYRAMMDAIRQDRAPSYFFLHPPSLHYGAASYSSNRMSRRSLRRRMPHFAFPPSAIVKCPPLSPTARRAGWVAFFHPQTRHKAGAFSGKKETWLQF